MVLKKALNLVFPRTHVLFSIYCWKKYTLFKFIHKMIYC
jgi:hypothetical protein